MDRLQQPGQQSLLQRDRGTTTLQGEAAEAGVAPIESLNRQPPHLPQEMGPGDPVLSCRPCIRSLALGHSVADGSVIQRSPQAVLAMRATFSGQGTGIRAAPFLSIDGRMVQTAATTAQATEGIFIEGVFTENVFTEDVCMNAGGHSAPG